MLEKTSVALSDVVPGLRYRVEGDLQNGDFVTHEEVTRKIAFITKKHIVLECGRKFIINDNLKIYHPL